MMNAAHDQLLQEAFHITSAWISQQAYERWKIWGLEKLGNLPKVVQMGTTEAEFKTVLEL